VIIFETAYKIDNFECKDFLTYNELESEISKSGLSIKDKYIWEKDIVINMNEENNKKIKKRVDELILQNPNKKGLFYAFYNNQIAESELLNNSLRCVSVLLC